MEAFSTALTPCCWLLWRCGTLNSSAIRSNWNQTQEARKTLTRLAILGSTGSIGQSTLSIVEQFPERYSIASLAAGRNVEEAFAQAVRWRPRVVSLASEELSGQLSERLEQAGGLGVGVV